MQDKTKNDIRERESPLFMACPHKLTAICVHEEKKYEAMLLKNSIYFSNIIL